MTTPKKTHESRGYQSYTLSSPYAKTHRMVENYHYKNSPQSVSRKQNSPDNTRRRTFPSSRSPESHTRRRSSSPVLNRESQLNSENHFNPKNHTDSNNNNSPENKRNSSLVIPTLKKSSPSYSKKYLNQIPSSNSNRVQSTQGIPQRNAPRTRALSNSPPDARGRSENRRSPSNRKSAPSESSSTRRKSLAERRELSDLNLNVSEMRSEYTHISAATNGSRNDGKSPLSPHSAKNIVKTAQGLKLNNRSPSPSSNSNRYRSGKKRLSPSSSPGSPSSGRSPNSSNRSSPTEIESYLSSRNRLHRKIKLKSLEFNDSMVTTNQHIFTVGYQTSSTSIAGEAAVRMLWIRNQQIISSEVLEDILIAGGQQDPMEGYLGVSLLHKRNSRLSKHLKIVDFFWYSSTDFVIQAIIDLQYVLQHSDQLHDKSACAILTRFPETVVFYMDKDSSEGSFIIDPYPRSSHGASIVMFDDVQSLASYLRMVFPEMKHPECLPVEMVVVGRRGNQYTPFNIKNVSQDISSSNTESDEYEEEPFTLFPSPEPSNVMDLYREMKNLQSHLKREKEEIAEMKKSLKHESQRDLQKSEIEHPNSYGEMYRHALLDHRPERARREDMNRRGWNMNNNRSVSPFKNAENISYRDFNDSNDELTVNNGHGRYLNEMDEDNKEMKYGNEEQENEDEDEEIKNTLQSVWECIGKMKNQVNAM
eukprot:gb/GECH01010572.1/.p1 GENE.gb/GECH01010572.1/~~gb/GECH01010572.1/.p1  ORF type:complete len:702 (+),score=193.26 gb/GECH01010572.1/:1-2106(+)